MTITRDQLRTLNISGVKTGKRLALGTPGLTMPKLQHGMLDC